MTGGARGRGKAEPECTRSHELFELAPRQACSHQPIEPPSMGQIQAGRTEGLRSSSPNETRHQAFWSAPSLEQNEEWAVQRGTLHDTAKPSRLTSGINPIVGGLRGPSHLSQARLWPGDLVRPSRSFTRASGPGSQGLTPGKIFPKLWWGVRWWAFPKRKPCAICTSKCCTIGFPNSFPRVSHAK